MKIEYTLLAVLISFNLLVTAQTSKFVAKDKSFEISYPSDWEVSKDLPIGVPFMVLSKQQNDSDIFRDNVNMLIDDLKGNEITAEEYGIMCKPMIRRMITDYKEVESKKIKMGVRDAYMLIYTGKQGIYSLKYNQVVFTEKGKAYIITYTSEPKSYNSFVKSFGTIANSVVVK